MKHCFLLLAILFSSPAISQNEVAPFEMRKGKIQAGLMLGSGFGNSLGGHLRTTSYVQYFIAHKWALQLEGRYNTNGFGAFQDQYAGVGLSSRYYFFTNNKLAVFGQLGYFYGQAATGMYRTAWQSAPSEANFIERYTSRVNYSMGTIGLGANYKLSPRWYIYALGEGYIKSNSSNASSDNYNLNVGIGFRIK